MAELPDRGESTAHIVSLTQARHVKPGDVVYCHYTRPDPHNLTSHIMYGAWLTVTTEPKSASDETVSFLGQLPGDDNSLRYVESTFDAPIPIRWPAPEDMDPEYATTIQMLHDENNRLRARVNFMASAVRNATSIIENLDLTQEAP